MAAAADPSVFVFAASKSAVDIRCGDKVEVEWDGDWYAGTVTDIPNEEHFCVLYREGDFEEAVRLSLSPSSPPLPPPPPSPACHPSPPSSLRRGACL